MICKDVAIFFNNDISVPELTVTKHRNLFTDKSNVRMAKNRFSILSVSQASLPQLLSKQQFDFGILTLNSLHIFMSLLRSKSIHNCAHFNYKSVPILLLGQMTGLDHLFINYNT